VLNVAGHKEDRLTTDTAEQLAAGLGSVVTVAAGIHYDDLDESGIETILRLAQRAVERILVAWHAAGRGPDETERIEGSKDSAGVLFVADALKEVGDECGA
jgi:hypothetical protein